MEECIRGLFREVRNEKVSCVLVFERSFFFGERIRFSRTLYFEGFLFFLC